MAVNPVGLTILGLSLLSAAVSQVVIKWRLGALAPGGVVDIPGFVRLAIADGWMWFGGCLLVGAATLWYLALSRLPLSFAMPFATLMTPLVITMSVVLLGEHITSQQIVATAVIVAGALWLGILRST